MNTEKKSFLETLNSKWISPLFAIITVVYGFFFAMQKNELENLKTKVDTELRQKEFENNLKLRIYDEVKSAMTLPPDTMKQKAVLLILNEMLKNDTIFREDLKTILFASSPNSKQLMNVQENIDKFSAEQANTTTAGFKIDVFYLNDIPAAKNNAENIADYIKRKYSGKYAVRVRLLPKEINARSGYRIDVNQIRFEPNEKQDADNVQGVITESGLYPSAPFKFFTTTNITSNYISIFVKD